MDRKYYITSDQHFSHSNIIKLCNRPFKDVEEMNQTMIQRWNEVVAENDIVYHLGDLFWNEKSAIDILPLLKGEIHLILGNHDKNWKRVRKRLERSPLNPASNLVVEEQNIVFLNEPIKAVLCHYPLVSFGEMSDGYKHYYGHVHNNINYDSFFRTNACVEMHNYYPIPLL
jgi:calcineurin-like phosphoesterase family protein